MRLPSIRPLAKARWRVVLVFARLKVGSEPPNAESFNVGSHNGTVAPLEDEKVTEARYAR